MSEPELKEWLVDWSVQVDVQCTKTVTVERSEIIEAATMEEAMEKAKDELWVQESEIAWDVEINPEVDFEIVTTDKDTFTVTSPVQEWVT